MAPTSSDLNSLIEHLSEEQDLAPQAMILSNKADHYDVAIARLLHSGEPAVLREMLALLGDTRPVLRGARPLSAGYGKPFGQVTVADKARFVLKRLLGAEVATEAIAQGPAWYEAHQSTLSWDAEAKRFVS